MLRKLTLIGLAVLVMAALVPGQTAWAQTNTFPASGNVGIGTLSPTAPLSIHDPTLASFDIREPAGNGLSYFRDDGSGNMILQRRSYSGAAIININPIVDDGTSNVNFRFFRLTNTTGVTSVRFYRGNGTTTLDAVIGVNGTNSYFRSGNFGIGTTTPTEKLEVNGNIKANLDVSAAVVEIRGSGNDLAEGFKINNPKDAIEPGMVVSICTENPGEMTLSTKPYERTVAGIISGAGGLHTGIQLGNAEEVKSGELTPVALTGRVWCHVDASYAAVQPGDLLTTSATIGHAMKAMDHTLSQGAIIGKAMTSLNNGKGLVLVLVSLQ